MLRKVKKNYDFSTCVKFGVGSDPDLDRHQNEKSGTDMDRHQNDADLKHCFLVWTYQNLL
jgi:hypothetical protein